MTTRTSVAEWRGPVPGGEGSVKLGGGAFEGRYAFGSRFENGASMALSLIPGGAGFSSPEARTWASEATFRTHAETAKRDCPVSKALTGVEIEPDARLAS